MSGILYLVGTPIGNLGDFSPRARETLELADFIAAEDTRVSMKLLNHFGIKKPMVSYYEHNRAGSGERILARLLAGERCALVTDAGMPAISDPGEDLVQLCAENGVPVEVIPGPSAVISAVALSALSTQRFCFEGFLSTNRRSRIEHLDSLRSERRTMVFYEAPHKLLRTLEDLIEYFGPDRPMTICRELTKLHEETLHTTAAQALAHFTDIPPKGEFVLVGQGAPEEPKAEMTLEQALDLVRQYRSGGDSLKSACKKASADSGFSKNELYDKVIGK